MVHPRLRLRKFGRIFSIPLHGHGRYPSRRMSFRDPRGVHPTLVIPQSLPPFRPRNPDVPLTTTPEETNDPSPTYSSCSLNRTVWVIPRISIFSNVNTSTSHCGCHRYNDVDSCLTRRCYVETHAIGCKLVRWAGISHWIVVKDASAAGGP